MDQLREGLVLGHRFRLVEPVSTGGPRGVWRAVDEAAGHEVAVKALGARAAWSMTDRARLRIAFGTVSALSDPGVARVHEYGEMALPGGLAIPYLVRELVPGQSLEERLGDGPAPVDEALGVVARVADALAVAHRAGVVHGNLVPGNVIVGPAGVKVTDFGLWALRDHLASAYRPDAPRQSVLSYAAPERLSGEPPSPAADMYSLGVLFVACLSGIAPGGTAGASPVMDPEDTVAPSLASLWAACLGANPRERPSAAHAAFMSRQILAAWPAPGQHDDVPTPAGHAAEPGAAVPDLPAAIAADAQEPGGAARPGDAAGRATAPAPSGGPASAGRRRHSNRHSTRPGALGRGGRSRSDRPGSAPRDLIRALRGRAGLVTLGVVAGVTAAVVMLTQFLASPSAQTTGAAATPSAHAQISQHAPASRPAPSAEVSSSVLASTAPPPLQVLNEIQATIRHGVADGQIRQDVGVDLDNLIQPIQARLATGNTAQVPGLVAGLRIKLATRLSEGAITQAADRQLNGELTTLLRASGRGQ